MEIGTPYNSNAVAVAISKNENYEENLPMTPFDENQINYESVD